MVLAERGGIGRTPCFAPVEIGEVAQGTFLPDRHDRRHGEHLTGTAASRAFGETLCEPPPTELLRAPEIRPGQDRAWARSSTKKKLDAETIAELEEALIRADMGAGQAASWRGGGQGPL